MIGVSNWIARGLRNPHPCALTTKILQCSANGRILSRLVTLTAISTRSRVLRRIAFGLCTSIMICSLQYSFGRSLGKGEFIVADFGSVQW
jgi:hypothetical protein